MTNDSLSQLASIASLYLRTNDSHHQLSLIAPTYLPNAQCPTGINCLF
ncbi:hypothetical protein LC605_19200 [Nostoc sp. CHAB 5836]|nr:hypothetical protein [Nostoc sp. CHAB 5836]